MKGLFVKEFLGIRSYFRIYLLIVAICVVPIVITGNGEFSAGFATGICTFIGGMICFTSFAYDATYRWDKFVLTLPYTREQIVRSKYAFSLIMVGIGMGIGLAMNGILCAAGLASIDAGILTATVMLMSLALLFVSIIIPLIYRFGVEKSRIAVIVIFLVPFMAFMAFSNGSDTANALEALMPVLTWLLPAVGVAATAISYPISVRIYRKQEI